MFVNRQSELAALDKAYQCNDPAFVVVYGHIARSLEVKETILRHSGLQ